MSKWWLLFLAIVCSSAHAACPGSSACLYWQASTQWTDGTPITTEVTYTVFRGSIAVGTTKLLALILGPEPTGNQCYTVTATAEGKTSVPSNQACKLIRPAAPTEGAIEAPSDGGIEDRR